MTFWHIDSSLFFHLVYLERLKKEERINRLKRSELNKHSDCVTIEHPFFYFILLLLVCMSSDLSSLCVCVCVSDLVLLLCSLGVKSGNSQISHIHPKKRGFGYKLL